MTLSILIVHYKTFGLTQQALWSYFEAYPDIPIYVVENASNDHSLAALEALKSEILTLHILPQSQNLHHGPGMDFGIRSIRSDYILLLDSDCILYKKGLIEALLQTAQQEDAYLVGHLQMVDKDGFDDRSGEIAYIHPHCALLHRQEYLTLPPFEKHGAPCLKNQIAAQQKGFVKADFKVQDFNYHIGRGTVRTEGYGLGVKGKMKSLLRKSKKLFSVKH